MAAPSLVWRADLNCSSPPSGILCAIIPVFNGHKSAGKYALYKNSKKLNSIRERRLWDYIATVR